MKNLTLPPYCLRYLKETHALLPCVHDELQTDVTRLDM